MWTTIVIQIFAKVLILQFHAVFTSTNEENYLSHNFTITKECILNQKIKPSCRDLKYQTIDGTCNNPLNPLAGAARLPYKRLLPPSYGDGSKTFRRSVNGGPLPSPRVISNVFNQETNESNAESISVNAMFVQFGQYMTHDLAASPTVNEENGDEVDCACGSPSPSCINIPVPANDSFYTSEKTCIPLKGSQVAQGCRHLPTEQINSITAFVDAGTIYGSNEELLLALKDRDSDHGALRLVAKDGTTTTSQQQSTCPFHRNKRLLPTVKDVNQAIAKSFACPAHFNSPPCFISGEDRVNENIGLSSAHVIFTREHNRIAKRLKTINKHWDSNTVFHETRRIMIAIHQKITYGEFLPLLLGSTMMKQFDLRNTKSGFYYGYDATYDATVSNSFTTAAFRYGHSQVGSFYHRPGPDYVSTEDPSIPTFLGLFRQEAVLNGSTPAIMRGLMLDPAKTTDPQFVDDLRNRMFESESKHGNDLFAINIQRGRAHGLPPYNDFRELCGLPKAYSWVELLDTMSNSTVEKLKSIYQNIDDIDLYVGGIAEKNMPGANVGPVFGSIIAHQFRDIKKGDRFWFENPNQFSQEQLREIRKVTLSRILCDNMDGMKTVPPSAMELEGELNTRVQCEKLPQMNINIWKEQNLQQDGVWTRWFPSENISKQNILQKLLSTYPESVCLNPIEIESSAIREEHDDWIKIRFLCPKGSIRYSGFPNVKNSLNYYWTEWFDRDTPSKTSGNDEESLSHLRMERVGEICEKPLYMQAQTKAKESAYDSDEVFFALGPKYGLICKGSDQTNGRCKDYRVRFYCPKDYKEKMMYEKHELTQNPRYVWTNWINLSHPRHGYGYEMETLGLARSRMFRICWRPLLIEGRVVGSKISASSSSDVLMRYSVYYGLICDNRDQVNGQCRDYEVRYLCPASYMYNEKTS